MKVFIHAHYYLPGTFAGAERYLHEIAKYLLQKGHQVIVAIDALGEYEYEGVYVVENSSRITERYTWADAVLTHLEHAAEAIDLAGTYRKPLFHLLHNNTPAAELYQSPEKNFIIYNSFCLQDELRLPLPFIVARPPINQAHWKNEIDHYYAEFITLVNCCQTKGGQFLQQIADALPAYRFLGVKGGYNDQIIQLNRHRNIQFFPQQADMKFVYDRTRILIVPSVYESWGMVAGEAMASGIPVICTDTPGLRENCGNAALYCEVRVQPYREAIEALADRDFYNELVTRGQRMNKPIDLPKILKFMETNTTTPAAVTATPAEETKTEKAEIVEKKEKDQIKEKKEVDPIKKKFIEKPGSIKSEVKRCCGH
jgi:glycosyltransferase involved in cell wall biosynthesis